MSVLRIAHRGASGEAPENTLAAFRRAVELGADMVECDLQMTADGAIVVMHDDTVDRTTDGRGRVADLRVPDIRRLDAGSWFAPRFRNERVPLLGELLETLHGRAGVNLEIKTRPDGDYDGIVKRILRRLGALRAFDEAVISSFDVRAIAAVRRAAPRVRTAIIASQSSPRAALAAARKLSVWAIHPEKTRCIPSLIRAAHASRLRVHAWTVNTPRDIRRVLAAGVDGIISNYPARIPKAS